MVKGYTASRHAYAGNNPDFDGVARDHHYPDEDAWLFVPGRKSQSQPWHYEQPSRTLDTVICPHCKANVKAVNLPKHLRKVHQGTPQVLK